MLKSNFKIVNTVWVLAPLLLVACHIPKPKEKTGVQNGTASFFIDKAEAVFVEQKTEGENSLNNSKTISFKACIKENKHKQVVDNSPFEVRKAKNRPQKLKTDANGCFSWSETFDLTINQEAKLYLVERDILGTGFYKGNTKAAFAVNFNDQKVYSQLNFDIKTESLENENKLTKRSDHTALPELKFDRTDFIISEKTDSTGKQQILLDMILKPAFEAYSQSQNKKLELITQGQFKMSANLFINANGVKKSVSSNKWDKVEIVDGAIRAQFPLNLKEACFQGQVLINLDVQMLNQNKMSSFIGDYYITDCDRLKGHSFGVLQSRSTGHSVVANPGLKTGQKNQINPIHQMNLEIHAGSFEFDKIDIIHSVDEFLNLRISKTGLFEMRPQLVRPSQSETTGATERPLPVGKYSLVLAVLNSKQTEVISISEKTIRVEAPGLITEEMTMSTDQLNSYGNTNWLYIYLNPESKDLPRSLFRGPITNGSTSEYGKIKLFAKENDAENIISKFLSDFKEKSAQKSAFFESQYNKVKFAELSQLKMVNVTGPEYAEFLENLNNPDFYRKNTSQNKKSNIKSIFLESILSQNSIPKEFLKPLCEYWINDFMQRPNPTSALKNEDSVVSRLTRACEKKNSRFFDIHFRKFVKSVKTLKTGSVQISDFSFSNSYSINQSLSHNTTRSWGWDANAGVKLFTSPIASSSSGFKVAITKSETGSNTQTQTLTSTSSVNSIIEKMTLDLQAEEVENCLVIKVNPVMFLGEKNIFKNSWNKELKADGQIHSAKSGLILCEGKLQKRNETFSESYYIMNQKINGAVVSNFNSDVARPYHAAIRGENDFIAFISFLQKDNPIAEKDKPTFLSVIKYIFSSEKPADSMKTNTYGNEVKNNRWLEQYLKGMPSASGQFLVYPQIYE